MKKLIPILLIFLCSCGQKSRLTDDFYEVVNNYFSDSLKNVDVVFLETTPIYQGPIMDSPPTHLDLTNVNAYFELKLIDSIDVNYIYNQIDSSSWLMDSNKLKVRSLSDERISKIIELNDSSDIYDVLKTNYQLRNYARISTPLYSRDGNTIILYLGVHRGKLSGQGLQLFFKRLDGKWTLIREIGTWKS